VTGGKGSPFLPSSSLTRSPLHRPGSADIHPLAVLVQGRRKLEQEIEAEKQRIEDERRRKIEVPPVSCPSEAAYGLTARKCSHWNMIRIGEMI